jgi:hypothetical protein
MEVSFISCSFFLVQWMFSAEASHALCQFSKLKYVEPYLHLPIPSERTQGRLYILSLVTRAIK